MIIMKGVRKSFGPVQALNGLDLHVKKGAIYGLVGTNGAGKTTAIRHLTGMLRPEKGEILLDGQPVWENPEIKQRIGVIPDELFFPHGYSMQEMASWYNRTYQAWNQQRFQEMTETFGLDTRRRLRTFSKGMKKQAAFCLVMATKPDFLLLDEPIDGLDPIVRKQVWKVIVEDVAERETTVLVSSHNLKEMEGICDSIGILERGRCVLEKDLDDLRGRMHKVQVAFPGGKWPENLLEGRPGIRLLRRESRGSIEMLILKGDQEEITAAIQAAGPLVFDVLPLSLEEIFIYEIGGEGDDIQQLIF